MPRKSTAWAASCAAALVLLSGCQFFGIDTRPDIRYVTEKERKNVAEPMYSMPVAGTNLFKQWPMRLGADYGFAPWEKKRGAAVAANAPATAGVSAQGALAAATTQTPSASANPSDTAPPATAAPNKAIALAEAAKAAANKPASATAKPSNRATPRLASGDLAESAASPATASESWNAERNAAHGDGIVVVDDLDVPVAARGDLEFRAPGEEAVPVAQPQAAAASVARSRSAARTPRPPVDEDLAWGGTHAEDSGDDAIADAESHAALARSAPPSASGVALQQPGAFAARKVATTSPRRPMKRAAPTTGNVLRDEAVRPATAEFPATRPATRTEMRPANAARTYASPMGRLHAPAAAVDGADVGDELVPPAGDELADDPLANLPAGLSDVEAMHAPPKNSARPAPRIVAPPMMKAEPTRLEPRKGAYRPTGDGGGDGGGDEPVFVTASDMGGDELPYADASSQHAPARSAAEASERESPARAYANPYFTESAPAESTQADAAFDRGETTDKLSELEAAKRRILQ